MTIRVLLADDQPLLTATFRLLIDSQPDLEVVAEAADGQRAVELTRRHRPDVVVLDIRMPRMDGLAATEAIGADPELSLTRVLILTTFETDEYVARALRAGASGFVGKDVSADGLLAAIRTVAGGEALLSPTATQALIARFLATPEPAERPELSGLLAGLTTREREIVALVARGHPNGEIAQLLTISPLTVRTHIQRAMAKLRARDRAQLVVIAYQSGLVRPTTPADR
ncbi:response regulator transcription factor [Frankia sp. CNm7]|uniref:Response regulator transcription factor n=1 Tax=Frankia nepalensis TaxID=1836974 RepID=A0A937RFX5_9ACTN|nr:response regulator transcription factor [Frankia nepalensis]MBL7495840.1 response regulator transcription factor [Frankia nepalensis]MBL7509916.1 response regulator transcription factor [Frankia nepalensis]MBL7523693.1 response regulator transcription factor [Frankia nepalensis]MBL7629675.1 response regulator transcription factor [Frankia nepalensis]